MFRIFFLCIKIIVTHKSFRFFYLPKWHQMGRNLVPSQLSQILNHRSFWWNWGRKFFSLQTYIFVFRANLSYSSIIFSVLHNFLSCFVVFQHIGWFLFGIFDQWETRKCWFSSQFASFSRCFLTFVWEAWLGLSSMIHVIV